MDIAFIFIVFGGIIFLGLAASLFLNPGKQLKKIFEEMSRELGIKSMSIALSPEIDVSGIIEGHEIEINQSPGGYEHGALNIYMASPFKNLGSFSIRSMNSRDSIGIPLHDDDIQCGDKIFDQRFFLLASQQYRLIGKLNYRCRGYFMELAELVQIELISDQVIKLKINKEPLSDLKERLNYSIKLILKIIKRFNDPANPDLELRQNCLSDPDALVRTANLKELYFNHSIGFNINEIIEKSLGDKNWDVKLTAAEFSAKKGLPVMVEALALKDERINGLAVEIFNRMGFKDFDQDFQQPLMALTNSQSIKLLISVLKKWPRKNTIALIHHWLTIGTDLVKVECLKVLKINGVVEDIPVIRSILENTGASQLHRLAEETIKAIALRAPDKGMEGALSQTESYENGQLSIDCSENGHVSKTD